MGIACVLGGGAWLGLTWLGYPAWLALRAAGKPPVAGAPFIGSLAIIVVVRNEAPRIATRIAELLALELPPGCKLREILIVDDGSSDGTADLAREIIAEAPPGHRLHLLVQPTSSGKAAGLALAVSHTRADVLVLADVRQQLPSAALAPLLAPFADPAIGVVSGVVHKPARTGPGLYWRYETLVRRLESRSGSTIGATGPWYAIRRALFVAPPTGLILDDVWIPLRAVFAGARAVVAEDAIVHDVEHTPGVERDKKARTLTGNLQLLQVWPALLDPRANPLWGRFIAHKAARLGTPFALTAIAVGGVALAIRPGPLQPLGIGLVGAHVAVVAAALLGSAPARTALEVHRASLEAWWRWARRDFRWSSNPP